MARPRRDTNLVAVPAASTSPSIGTCTELPPVVHPNKKYIDEFRTWRMKIETSLLARESDNTSQTLLRQAEDALCDFELDLDATLLDIADRLEEKFEELVDAIGGNWRGLKKDKRPKLPGDLENSPDLHWLRRPIARAQRRFLFLGQMTGILYQYRDEGLALVHKKRKALLDKLDVAVEDLTHAVETLQRYIVIDQSLPHQFGQEANETLRRNAELASIVRDVVTSRGESGLASMLEDNGQQLRTQYTAACATLCLRLYGHVTPDILLQLLGLKSADYLERWGPGGLDAKGRATDRKRMDRQRAGAIARALARAKKEGWPSWPVLRLYSYNIDFGHAKVRPRPEIDDGGLSESGLMSAPGHSMSE